MLDFIRHEPSKAGEWRIAASEKSGGPKARKGGSLKFAEKRLTDFQLQEEPTMQSDEDEYDDFINAMRALPIPVDLINFDTSKHFNEMMVSPPRSEGDVV